MTRLQDPALDPGVLDADLPARPPTLRPRRTEIVDAIGRNLAPTEAEADRWIGHWDNPNPHPEKNGLPAFKDSPKGRA